MTALIIICAVAAFCLVMVATDWLLKRETEGRHAAPEVMDAETQRLLAEDETTLLPLHGDVAGQTMLMAAPVLGRRGEWTPRTEPPWRAEMAAALAPDVLDALAADPDLTDLRAGMERRARFEPGRWLPVLIDNDSPPAAFLDDHDLAAIGAYDDDDDPEPDPEAWLWEDDARFTSLLERFDEMFGRPVTPADPVWPHWGSFTAWLNDDVAAAA